MKIGGGVQSVWPCEYGFSGYWSLMVPPFKPESVLILGYGWGTTAALIKKIWGKEVHIIGVDTTLEPKRFDPNSMIQEDAKRFVKKNRGKVDVVLIDLFEGMYPSEFLMDDKFVRDVKRITKKLLILNSWLPVDEIAKTPWPKYFELDLIKASGGNNIYLLKPR